jgi:hypothetical protein
MRSARLKSCPERLAVFGRIVLGARLVALAFGGVAKMCCSHKC